MTIVGGFLLVVGLPMVVSGAAVWHSDDAAQAQCQLNNRFLCLNFGPFVASILIGVGVPLAIGGAFLTGIGAGREPLEVQSDGKSR